MVSMTVRWLAHIVAIVLVIKAVSASESDAVPKGYMLHPGLAGIQSYEGAFTSCLRQTVASFCDYDIGTASDMEVGALRSELACCSAKKDHGASDFTDFLSISAANVGHCEWTYTYSWLNHVQDYQETIPQLHGGFSVLCFLNNKAKDCITPFCDNMVLSAQGSIYHLENVLTDDVTENVFDACFDGLNNTERRQARNHAAGLDHSKAERPADKRMHARKNTQAKQAAGSAVTGQLYDVVIADIMSGPMTVQSTSSGKRWSGWMQAVYHMVLDGRSEQTAPGLGQVIVRPNDLNIQIFEGSPTAGY